MSYLRAYPKRLAAVLTFCSTITVTLRANEAVAKPDEAEALVQEGLQIRRTGRDEAALPKFEQAYTLAHTPRTAAQYGLCLQALSRWSEAHDLLSEALAVPKDPWVKKNLDTLKEAVEVAKTHMGRIEVIGSPAGAKVTVNGRAAGDVPLPAAVRVNEGSVDVEMTAPGFVPATRTLNVVGASYQRVVIRLEPQNLRPVAEEKASVMVVSAPVAPEDEQARPLYKSPWFWGGVAVVAAAIVVTSVALTSSTTYPTADKQGTWQQ